MALRVIEPDLAAGVPDRVPVTLAIGAVEVLAGDGLVAPVVRAVGAAGLQARVVEERRVEARAGAQIHEVRRLRRLKGAGALAIADLWLVALEVRRDGHDVAAAIGRVCRGTEQL